ncbi:MAG TPA: hypothetical protein VJ824_14820 [Bacillota bacterium]|nr:hypothetical protein [Bacillota bacterium]
MEEEIEGERQVVPHEEERVLLEKQKEAVRRRDHKAANNFCNALVALYVYYGESFKMSEQPDPTAAKYCLKKALKLNKDHPVANYRYAHLLYSHRDYAQAGFHFKKALDGNHREGLNDTQALIAQIFTVNCGILMAKEALREIDFLQNNLHAVFDGKLKAKYIERLLVDSEEMVAQHLYVKITPSGEQEHISEDRFTAEQSINGNAGVCLCVTPTERVIIYRGVPKTLSQTEFYVTHTVLMSEVWIQVKEIYDALSNGPLEETITPAAVRQSLRRLSREISFWDSIVESKTRGSYSVRKRRSGVEYKLLCHSSVVWL